MRTFLSLIFLLFLLPDLSAQRRFKATVSGLIKDIQNEPLPGATVKLLMAGDSSAVAVMASGNKGGFELEVGGPGVYLLAVSFTNMNLYWSRPFVLDSSKLKLQMPAIILVPEQHKELKEVTVTAKKPLLEYDLDKTIVNVESMLGAAAGNTLEVLQKTPGVTVDMNGEISLNGSTGVTVLIDGRSTFMSGNDLAAYLRSLPGSMLDKLELITNPPAKYEANGNAIINIKLKKKRTQGYVGNISHNSNIGRRYRTYNSINLNYLNKKVNLFGNFGYSRFADLNKTEDKRIFVNDNGQQLSAAALNNRSEAGSHEFSVRTGLDYTLNKKTILGFIFSGNKRMRNDQSSYTSKSFSNLSVPDSTGSGRNQTTGTWEQLNGNLNFQHFITDKGHEITGDFNFVRYNNRSEQDLSNNLLDQTGMLIRNNDFLYVLPYKTDVFTSRLDYSLPLKNRASFSSGLRTSSVRNDNQSDYFFIPESKPVPDYSRSNHFIYRENIHAAYVNARKDWKRFGLQLGLRWEYTHTKGSQLGNREVAASAFTRSYHSIFPSLFYSWKIDSAGRHQFTLSASRRINRPNYWQLNPFLFYNDQFSVTTGNPYLDPSYSNKLELGWRYKQLLNTRFMYERVNGMFANAQRFEKNIQINRSENFASREGMMLMVNINLNPSKWWNLNFNLAGAKFSTKGDLYDQHLDLEIYAWRTQLMQQFTFGKKWSAELFSSRESPIIKFMQRVNGRFWMNAAVQKKILKGKGSIKLNLEDIFQSTGFKEETKGLKNVYSFRVNDPDSRRVAISINYNFGKESFNRKRKYNDNAADDLKERAQ